MPDASDRRFDTRGCLSAAGLDAVRQAPVGGAPAELAHHLASCARCQERLLAADGGDDRERRPPPRRPQPMRTALLMLMFLLIAALSLVAMYWHLRG